MSYCGGDILGERGPRAQNVRVGGHGKAVWPGSRRAIVVKSAEIRAGPRALRKRTEIIPNGVDLDCFVRTSRECARGSAGMMVAAVVLFGGHRFHPRKNYRLAEAAVQESRPGGKHVKLIP